MKLTIENLFKRLEKTLGDKEVPLGYNTDPNDILSPLFDEELGKHFQHLDEDTLDLIIETLKVHLLGNETYDFYFAESILKNKNLTYQQFKRICHFGLMGVEQLKTADWYTFGQLVNHPYFEELMDYDKMMALSLKQVLSRSRLYKVNQNA